MRFFHAIIPNLSISLTLALLVLVILDCFNPLLGLLRGTLFLVLFGLDAACALCTAITLYLAWRKRG